MKSNQSSSDRLVQWIDFFVLSLISIVCFKYVANQGKIFAETAVNFSFLSFPVFVGEFLLMACVGLCVVRLGFVPFVWNRWWAGMTGFCVFFLSKAFWGYANWGPLALRDAALFYYLLFVMIGCVVFRREYFCSWLKFVVLAALFFLVFNARLNEHWLMPRIFLGMVVALTFKDWRVAAGITGLLIITTPFDLFLNVARAVILGNVCSIIFFLISLVLMIDKRYRRITALSAVGLIVGLIGYVFIFSGNKQAQGLFAWDKIRAIYQEADVCIQDKKATFKPRNLEGVNIFSKDAIVAPEQLDDPKWTAGSSNANSQGLSASSKSKNQSKQQISSGEKSLPDNPALNPNTKGDPLTITQMKIGNSVFRLLIWKDAKEELLKKRPLFGFDFGKPFRSQNIEIVRWGVEHWARDGWVAMHNSYLNWIYRGGLVGIALIVALWIAFIRCWWIFLRYRSWVGILVCSTLVVPFVIAYFAVTFEVPYMAIPVWTLFGFMLAMANQLDKLHQPRQAR